MGKEDVAPQGEEYEEVEESLERELESLEEDLCDNVDFGKVVGPVNFGKRKVHKRIS